MFDSSTDRRLFPSPQAPESAQLGGQHSAAIAIQSDGTIAGRPVPIGTSQPGQLRHWPSERGSIDRPDFVEILELGEEFHLISRRKFAGQQHGGVDQYRFIRQRHWQVGRANFRQLTQLENGQSVGQQRDSRLAGHDRRFLPLGTSQFDGQRAALRLPPETVEQVQRQLGSRFADRYGRRLFGGRQLAEQVDTGIPAGQPSGRSVREQYDQRPGGRCAAGLDAAVGGGHGLHLPLSHPILRAAVAAQDAGRRASDRIAAQLPDVQLRRVRVLQQRGPHVRRQPGRRAGEPSGAAQKLPTVHLRARLHGRHRPQRVHPGQHRRQPQSDPGRQQELCPFAVVPLGDAPGSAESPAGGQARFDIGRVERFEAERVAAETARPHEDANLSEVGR